MERARPAARAAALLAPVVTAAALLAACAWLGEPRIGYLASCVVATIAGVAVLRSARARPSRVPLLVALAALGIAAALATRAQLRLSRFARDPAAVGRDEAAAQHARLRVRVDEELRTLRALARRARAAPPEPIAAMQSLMRAVGDKDRRAALLLHGDTLFAWGGTLHADPGELVLPSGVVATPFGLTLYVVEDSGTVRTIAASLLYATPPADRLTRGLAQRLPGDEVSEGFSFAPPTDSLAPGDLRYVDGTRPLFIAHARIPSEGEVRFRLLERARFRVGLALLIALVAFLVAAASRGQGPLVLMGGAIVVARCIAIVRLSEFSSRSRLFDASVYFFPAGGAYTANAAALLLSSAVALLLALLATRRIGMRLPRVVAMAVAVVTILTGPFAVRALARGITPPASGAGGALWLIWSVPLCLAATALLVVAGWAGRRALSGRRGAPIAFGPLIALVAAVMAPLVWQAPGQWPQWYSIVWACAVAAVVLARPSHRTLLVCASVSALAATTVVWGSTSRGRVELAERDIRGLSTPDAYATTLANRLASTMQGDDLPRSAQALLERYVTSDLASAGYPVALLSYQGLQTVAAFGTAPIAAPYDSIAKVADRASRELHPVLTSTRSSVYAVQVVAVPMRTGAVAIVVAPRTRLMGTDAYARWIGLGSTENNEPPYNVKIAGAAPAPGTAIQWRREGTDLHGDWPVMGPTGVTRVHLEVDLRTLDALIPRGGLLVILNLAVVGVLWLVAAVADGRAGRWLRLRRRNIRSYRARLSVALFLFFLFPAAAFAVWSWQQLFNDAQASRRLLVTETMRAFAGDLAQPASLKEESRRLDTKLLLYQNGVLTQASDSVFADLAPMGRLLRPSVYMALDAAELSATMPEQLDGAVGMLGYRVLPATQSTVVLAAPARVDDLLLDRRRRDLGVLVLFATALGAAAALWLSAIAARQLARPIGVLRGAARAVARGEIDVPLDERAVSEFLPVFTAFRDMARDLGESRAALVEAQRRTDAVLRTVASGVVAVDEQGRVILANPRSEVLLGRVPPAGESVRGIPVAEVAARVTAFVAGDASGGGFEIEREGRTLRGQLTRLERGGAVLTLDDVTELARAQRVLAWGEMARQVAHEIKNPLTPIRLGVQHLRRARGRPDFDEVLEQNVSRILTEIDRLDEIARAFSRYGGAPAERAPAEPTDVGAIVADVVALETLGEGHVKWSQEIAASVPHALARGDELREVLLNVFENARHADARHVHAVVRSTGESAPRVHIEVRDDGSGMAADVLPKIFEPHFSTRTSGSGLGLAITRRLVESWGGEVTIESATGQGTTVRISLRGV